MSHKQVPLSSLVGAAANPRQDAEHSPVDGLAQTILTDGILQNLVVEPAEDGAYRVIAGTRRLRALHLLRDRGDIDGEYKVPVNIRRDADKEQAHRIATVENVQREPLAPIDEAEAFAAMLQHGATAEDVAAQTGVSTRTVRRRVALAGLCEEVKAATRSGTILLAVAEALTLGSAEEQRDILQMVDEGADLDGYDVRRLLTDEKPVVAIAIFPLERYTGTLTGDLFAEAETTYFDDIEQFVRLQQEAVEELAEQHRKSADWVEVLSSYSVAWWQYRKAADGEPGGIVINLSPSGVVEVREGLARHEVHETVLQECQGEERPAHERPRYNRPTLRHIAAHKSVAVMAALLDNPRKAKEIGATLLASQGWFGTQVRVTPHPALEYFAEEEAKPKAVSALATRARKLLSKLGVKPKPGDREPWRALCAVEQPLAAYKAIQALSGTELDRLIVFLLVHTFGQEEIETLDTGKSLFNQAARDIGIEIRDWWTPDEVFLAGLRRSELEQVAVESDASRRIRRLTSARKSDLVRALAGHFARTADPRAELDKLDRKGREWIPGTMRFPATLPADETTEA